MLDRVNVADRLIDLAREFAPGLPASNREASVFSLGDAGLSSMAAVKFMLAIEAAFSLAIPDAELTPENFATLAAVQALVERLRAG